MLQRRPKPLLNALSSFPLFVEASGLEADVGTDDYQEQLSADEAPEQVREACHYVNRPMQNKTIFMAAYMTKFKNKNVMFLLKNNYPNCTIIKVGFEVPSC